MSKRNKQNKKKRIRNYLFTLGDKGVITQRIFKQQESNTAAAI